MGKLVRAIAGDGSVICAAVDTTAMVAEAERIHKTSATVTAALGRLLTAGSVMGYMLKNTEDSVTLRLAGNGPVGAVIVVAEGTGNARGYVANPIVEIPLNKYGKLDVAGAVGTEGYLSIVKDVGLPEPQMSHSPIVSGEIAEDITYYYAMSEQVPTVCALGVLVNPDLTVQCAGGYLVQLLPGADDSVITKIEQNINQMESITKMLAQGMTPQEIAFKALDGFAPEVLDETEVEYRCNCSKERVERVLLSIGKTELLRIAEEDEATELDCHFCDRKYCFTSSEIKALVENA